MHPPDPEAEARRARELAQSGHHAQALALLSDVAATRPELPVLEEGIAWLHQPGVVDAMTLDFAGSRLLSRYLRMLQDAPSPMPPGDPRLANAEAAEHICRVLEARFPDRGIVYFAGAAIARRLGYFEEAIAQASKGYKVEPTWQTCIGVASAYRDAGKVDLAATAFEQALRLDPDKISPLLDLGDMLLDAERDERALAAYDRALERQPGHPWALPSALYLRATLEQDPTAGPRLLAMRETAGASPRARALADRLDPPRPWANHIPAPVDASADAVQQVLETIASRPEPESERASLTVTHPESPSVLLAFELGTKAMGRPSELDLVIERIPHPDPRLPKGEVEFSLWRWDGNRPVPDIPAPDPRAVEAMASMAREHYDIAAWEAAAQSTGSYFGAQWARNFAAVMAYPPLPPAEIDAISWVRRVQLAAALTIAFTEDTWDQSERRAVLYTLAMGPTDWSVEAAIVALARIATREVAARHDVLELFDWLGSQVPGEGLCAYQRTLAQVWRLVPDLDAATASRLDTIV